MHLCVQLCKLVQVSGVHWHVCIFYKWLCFCVLYCTKYRVQYHYFKLRISGSKHKSSGDITGSTVLFKVLYHKIKFFSYFLCLFFYVLFV